ncbi:MAG: DEAD/DEAH box helicase [Bdellovibrionales bacterium]|nr:DEAD/DEAH box helicase [Bdellovibrionales bacterium]
MNTDSDAAQWRDLGLSDDLLSLIEKAGFKSPTPIQSKAIPLALKGDDIVASAQTGSGKTACFCFPMIEKMMGRKGTYGLILSPTREIALQTQQTLEQFATPLGIRSVSLIGGVNLRSDEERLKSGPHILVGTPGRICDHLERGNLWLEYIEMLVLDEADRMLDMGFAKELNRITSEISDSRQTLLFSATIAPEIERLAKRILHNPKRVQVGRALATNRNVDQKVLLVNESQKLRELMYLLEEERETVIVFNRTKDNTFKLWRSSLDYGMEDSTYISSNKRQSDREKALEGFKDGVYRILFATDVAGRGIHVENVGHVINYDLPEEPEDYIHRIGRTGRQGATGKATSFVTPREMGQLRRIEKVLGSTIPSEQAPGFRMESSSRGRHGSGNRGRSRGPARGRSSGRSANSSRRTASSGRSRGGSGRSGSSRRGGRGR